MPELPEVETVVRTLRPRVAGRKIAKVAHVRDDMITPDGFDLSSALRGRTIRQLSRRGKRIVFDLDDGNRFFIHLGMSGRLTMLPRDADIEQHTHLIVDFARGSDQLRFRDPRRFGAIRWLGKDGGDRAMGPEPLTMRPSQLQAKIAKTKRSIKNALMDQRVVAGLGNIYVDESLFDSGIHPTHIASKLKPADIIRLTQSIKRVLKRAIAHRGSTMRDYVDGRGKRGRFQRLHRVYQRAGKACASCKSPIERIVIGGRSTHYCPRCQPGKRQPEKRQREKR
jgi:formamidopyrimidine-DNA glycosylase